MASDIHVNPGFLKEWEIARNVLTDFDAHLHDLRKYGFSFLTALLTAESFLLPTWTASADSTVLPDLSKVAVLIVDLILIVALALIDRNYKVFQRAAATRAMILERTLNLELTEVISFRYSVANVSVYVFGVYLAFTVGVLVLGSAVLYPNYLSIVTLEIVAIIVQFFVWRCANLRYPYGEIDWTLDRLHCTVSDEVGITLTNLGRTPIQFTPGTIMWEIKKEGAHDAVAIADARLTQPLTIRAEDSYTWLWKPADVEEGIYRVYRLTHHEKPTLFTALNRKLRSHGDRVTLPENSQPLVPLRRKLRILRHRHDKNTGTRERSLAQQTAESAPTT